MATERVDWREPSGGLARPLPLAFSKTEPALFSFSASALTDCLIAGEAGIVLSRFLVSETPAARKEDVPGLVIGRELALGGRVVFVGEPMLARPIDFLSDPVLAWIPGFFSAASRVEVVAPAKDILLGAPSVGFGFISSPDVTALRFSSAELIDARPSCPRPALMELAVGFLNEEATVGRAGGLLRVEPVVVLAVVAEGSFEVESVEVFGFVVGVPMVLFGTEAAFDFAGEESIAAAASSRKSTGSSIAAVLRISD